MGSRPCKEKENGRKQPGEGQRNMDGTRNTQTNQGGGDVRRTNRRREIKRMYQGEHWAVIIQAPFSLCKVRFCPNCAFWAVSQARGCLMDLSSKRLTCAAAPELISPNQPDTTPQTTLTNVLKPLLRANEGDSRIPYYHKAH